MGLRHVCVPVLALLLTGCSGDERSDVDLPAPSGITAGTGSPDAECASSDVLSRGCIRLGVLGRDASAAGSRIRDAQRAFWARVNEEGGINGLGVVLQRGVGDDVLAYLGTSQETGPPMSALPRGTYVAGTTPLSSRWLFEERVLQTGGSACIQAMNAVDVLEFRGAEVGSVAVVHPDDELGRDAAAGARLAAARRGLDVMDLETGPGTDQSAVVSEVLTRDPDVLVLAVPPAHLESIVVGAVEAGFPGAVATTSRGWDPRLAGGPHGRLLADHLVIAQSWREYTLATPGYGAMRTALGEVPPDDDYTAGWIGNYPLLALLRAGDAAGDLSRQGLRAAARRLDDVDYDAMFPPLIGTPFAGSPTAQAAVRTVFEIPDPTSVTGTETIEDYFNGLTVASHRFTRPCFEAG